MTRHVVLYSFCILVAFLYIPYGNDLLHISNKRVVSETLIMVTLPDRGRGPKLFDLENHDF